ncbi:hypothetical protein LEAN103870_04965 [Legionella anisa]|uniref:Uncharacterized protein n=1 Tax=Legionella anisa TaxID=28082 RepID=A0AAX0WQU2_9GAMM|nr:hypothetical protein [Legionella anisa]AWN73125.1 hypothetical protein DLD14_04325 [Legionella anisa]KTC67440.1 hypothetical protein Lani_3785 [Legionella anisa]MBN5936449.1 hypothetical protein [Legionella anisa]MCW8423955.1 hypothetical protein [Legionella anisa]MCW8447477.1 hypothetical protein [Legionella anisa]
MPKNPKNSKKIPEHITQDNMVVSLKSKDSKLTVQEKQTLNQIYNESTLRLERTLDLLTQLENYLNSYDSQTKNQVQNIKQLMIDNNAPAEILHTLKMLKRHFYIPITHDNTINNVLNSTAAIKNNLLKTYKGLKGQLNLSLEIVDHVPTPEEVENFEDKTYVLVKSNNQWSLLYYENKGNPTEINIDNVNPAINNMATVDGAKLNYHLLMRDIMLYHAKNVESQPNKVYISNLKQSYINNPNNRTLGYVNGNGPTDGDGNLLFVNEYFGAIHIDYRLLTTNPSRALGTLIHESMHRYGFVNDRGYYHGRKDVKNSTEQRRYPEDFRDLPKQTHSDRLRITSRATNNADSYAYFVLDTTGSQTLYDKDNLPDWYDISKENGLPVENSSLSPLIKYSLIAGGVFLIGVGATMLYRKSNSIAEPTEEETNLTNSLGPC